MISGAACLEILNRGRYFQRCQNKSKMFYDEEVDRGNQGFKVKGCKSSTRLTISDSECTEHIVCIGLMVD